MTGQLTYIELLNTTDWQNRREEILIRDKNICHSCCNSTYTSPNNFKIGKVDYSQLWNGINNLPFEIYFDKSNKIEVNPGWISTVSAKAQMATLFEPRHDLFYFILNRSNLNEINALFSIKKAAFERRKSDFNVTRNPVYLHFTTLQNAGEITWHFVKNLHVHHRYYQTGLSPWDYPDTALQTLCWSCHKKLHEKEKVPFYNKSQEIMGELTPCPRCFGAGHFPEFMHVKNGVCFECNGSRFEEFMK